MFQRRSVHIGSGSYAHHFLEKLATARYVLFGKGASVLKTSRTYPSGATRCAVRQNHSGRSCGGASVEAPRLTRSAYIASTSSTLKTTTPRWPVCMGAGWVSPNADCAIVVRAGSNSTHYRYFAHSIGVGCGNSDVISTRRPSRNAI